MNIARRAHCLMTCGAWICLLANGGSAPRASDKIPRGPAGLLTAQREKSSPPVKGTGKAPKKAAAAQPVAVYRASDPPPKHDDNKLAKAGIHKYSSKRLRLYTDLPADQARELPELMDRAYDAWTDYFGPLPSDREGTEFVMTGYLMVDQALFRETGLLPENLPPFPHGRNKGTQFWLNEQPTPYYRRHLLLHEGTHCFMTAVRHPLQGNVWYMEGMAELFGTHRFDADGRPQFRVMPDDREQFANLGRIRLVEDEVKEKGPRPLSELLNLVSNDFLSNPPYAWSWALCQFLDGDPRYHEAFQAAGRSVVTGDKTAAWDQLFTTNRADLDEAWLLFAANLCHGYDQARAAVEFRAGKPLRGSDPAKIEIVADRGWQSTGVQVEKGERYRVTGAGRFVIANAAGRTRAGAPRPGPDASTTGGRANRPWECEPQGISIRYHAGHPLGMLVGTIRATPAPMSPPYTTMLDVVPIGRDATFTAAVTGTLYLRVNDAWNELGDNSGTVEVKVERVMR